MGAERAILLVDDEAIILLALRQELRTALGAAYRFEIAVSAAEALEVIESLDSQGIMVDLVVSDWLMPGMRGDEFLMRVRERRPEVKTVMISGQTDEDRLDRLKASGALDAFVRKPWNSFRLAVECRRLLAGG